MKEGARKSGLRRKMPPLAHVYADSAPGFYPAGARRPEAATFSVFPEAADACGIRERLCRQEDSSSDDDPVTRDRRSRTFRWERPSGAESTSAGRTRRRGSGGRSGCLSCISSFLQAYSNPFHPKSEWGGRSERPVIRRRLTIGCRGWVGDSPGVRGACRRRPFSRSARRRSPGRKGETKGGAG